MHAVSKHYGARVFGRVLFVAALLSYVGGCASYRSARLPAGASDSAGMAKAPVEVTVGHQAKVALRNGEVVEGEVEAVSPTSIALGKVGNFGYVVVEVAAADIVQIEVVDDGDGADAVLHMFGSVAALFAGVIVVIFVAAALGYVHIGGGN